MTELKREPGSVLRIPLNDGRHGFGRLLKGPLVEFFDVRQGEDDPTPAAGEVVQAPVLFRVWVMNAVANGWKLLGMVPLSHEEQEEIHRFAKQDAITGALSIYWSDPRTGSHGQAPATLSECQDLELAGVWSAPRVVDRLRAHLDGRAAEISETWKPMEPDEFVRQRAPWPPA